MSKSIFDGESDCSNRALKSVDEMNLPKKIHIHYDSFSRLGPNMNAIASFNLIELNKVHGKKLPYLFGIAVRESNFFWYFNDHFSNDWISREPHLKDWIHTYHGSSGIVASSLGMIGESSAQESFRDKTPYKKRDYKDDILTCLAVYWFASADKEIRAGNTEKAFDLIHEAYGALREVQSDEMWIHSAKNLQENASERGKKAANALHDKPGNSREKREAISTAWASGKYGSRDLCAEQECAALNMSFSTARKALRNTPEPPSRCTA